MRVLQIGPYAPPHGGVHANLSAIRDAIIGRGDSCEVIAITKPDRPVEREEGIYRPRTAFALLRLLFSLKYDIVHLHLGGMLTNRLIGLTLVCGLLPRKKKVITFHSGGYPSSPKGQSAKPFSVRGFAFRLYDRIICVNAEMIAMFKKFGVGENRLRHIYPYSFDVPPEDTPVPQNLKDFLNVHNPLLVNIAQLETHYDLALQIDVMEKVLENFPNAGLIIIGAGSLEEDLRARIKSKPYSSKVLLCGDVARIVTLKIIQKSDLLLRTTLYDGDAISVREGLFLGTPVIATDNGMRPEGVYLVPISNLPALHAAILKVLNNKSERQSGNDNGKKNIEEILNLYDELYQ